MLRLVDNSCFTFNDNMHDIGSWYIELSSFTGIGSSNRAVACMILVVGT